MKIILTSLILIALVLACAEKKKSTTETESVVDGQHIYKKYCILCHGADGKLGVNGAKDITVSKLTLAERIDQIKKGKKTMTPFEGILSEEEMKAVATYSMTLK